MKEKILVWGCGKDFEEFKERIDSTYQVVGITDSRNRPAEEKWDKLFISPAEIHQIDYHKILICSRKYYGAIEARLLEQGIPHEKIWGLSELRLQDDQGSWDGVLEDLHTYRRNNTDTLFEVQDDDLWLIAGDKSDSAGGPCPHYFAQDIWCARKIFQNNPKEHYDIGSRLDGFIAHLLCFREVNYIDVRPLPYDIPGLHFIQGDAMRLEDFQIKDVESLSCLHALEHFGLGRYGDPLDPVGYRKAILQMQKAVKKGGILYISVPVGSSNKCCFNAHRIFKISTVVELFDQCNLRELHIITPEGVKETEIAEEEYGMIEEFSCGLFEFQKR